MGEKERPDIIDAIQEAAAAGWIDWGGLGYGTWVIGVGTCWPVISGARRADGR